LTLLPAQGYLLRVKPRYSISGFARSLWREYAEAFTSFSRNARLYLLGSFLLGIGANQISLLWNLYLKSIGYSPTVIGQTLSLKALGSAVLALPAAFFVARIDSRRLLPSAAFLVAAAYVAQSLALSVSVVSAAVFMAGAFSTVFQVSTGPFFMRNSGPRERIHLFSLNSALSMGTGLIGSLAGGFLKDGLVAAGVPETWAYRIGLLAGAAFVLAAFIPFARIDERNAMGDATKPGAPADGDCGATGAGGTPGQAGAGATADPASRAGGTAAAVAGAAVAGAAGAGAVAPAGAANGTKADRIGPALWVKLVLPGFLIGIGAGLTVPYLNLYFKLVFNLGDGAIGAAVAAGQVATFLGMAASPLLARKIGKARSVFVTQGVSIPLILVLAFVGSLPLALAAYLARQVFMNMSTPISDNFALELVPQSRQGLVNAVKMLAWTGSWAISARVSGGLIDSRGFAPSFVLTASCYALSTLLFWLFFIRGKPRQATA
jgi:MFS family permease